ncbi:hypothetical protein ASPCAL04713 [Aspergillus calidoustus]|uniref:Uncharacterized protein n=1 Tax=Aspergillus calidoustus TaxID=454130 RepID=A0A0U5FZC8_ASPCI|nr:hypothetical protein ASPCAL04713 [Aspergillus calidoustus]
MSEQCGFPGNSDLYGLGIRLGIYLQWLSAQTAAFFYLADTNTLFFNYIIFTVAIIIAVIVLTFQGETHAVEMIVMIYMFFGGLFCVQQRKSQFLQNRTMGWRVLTRIATVLAMLIYSSWFWAAGVSSGRFAATPCGNTIFLFARIAPVHFHQVRWLFVALSISLCAGFIVFYVHIYSNSVRGLLATAKRTWRVKKSSGESLESRAVVMQLLNDRVTSRDWDMLLLYYGSLSFGSTISPIRVTEVHKTHLLLRASDHDGPRVLVFVPPLSTFAEAESRLYQMMAPIHRELFMNPDDASMNLSVSGRIRTSGRHVLAGLEAFGDLFRSQDNSPQTLIYHAADMLRELDATDDAETSFRGDLRYCPSIHPLPSGGHDILQVASHVRSRTT